MQTISQQDFAKQYGQDTLAKFNQPQQPTGQQSTPATPNQADIPSGNYFKSIGDAFSGGVSKIKQGISEANPMGPGGVGGLVTGVGKILGGATEAVTSPIAPAFNAVAQGPIQRAGHVISKIPAVQKFAMSPAGKTAATAAETVGNYAEGAGLVAGAAGVPKPNIGEVKAAPEVVPEAAATEGPGLLDKAASYAKSTYKDIVPDSQRVINHQISRALDLTPGDLDKITRSTGNDVGTWLSDHNLIGQSKDATRGLIDDFFQKNYKDVRSEIAKVDTVFKPSQVPRYTDALKAIQRQVSGTPGLEKEGAAIENLLNKQDISLQDVQHVKELLDEHFSLYNALGDVAENTSKKGLANIRDDLKGFIEKQVKDNTGADIRQLNNDVATSKTLGEAIETRDPKTLTRANLTTRDIMIGWSASMFGGPLVGIAAVLLKKLATSPTVRLRIARYIDSVSDARKAKIKAELDAGRVPPELEQVANPAQAPQPGAPSSGSSPNGSTLLDKAKGVINTIKTEGQKGFVKNPFASKVTAADTMKDTLLSELQKPAVVKTGKQINLGIQDEIDQFTQFLKQTKDPTIEEMNKGLELLRLQGKDVSKIADQILQETKKQYESQYKQLRDSIGRFKGKTNVAQAK